MDLIPPSPGLELATFPARARGLCGLAWPVPVVALGPGRWQWWLCGTVSPPGHPSLTCCSQFCLVLVQKAGPVPACEPGTRRRLSLLSQAAPESRQKYFNPPCWGGGEKWLLQIATVVTCHTPCHPGWRGSFISVDIQNYINIYFYPWISRFISMDIPEAVPCWLRPVALSPLGTLKCPKA